MTGDLRDTPLPLGLVIKLRVRGPEVLLGTLTLFVLASLSSMDPSWHNQARPISDHQSQTGRSPPGEFFVPNACVFPEGRA